MASPTASNVLYFAAGVLYALAAFVWIDMTPGLDATQSEDLQSTYWQAITLGSVGTIAFVIFHRVLRGSSRPASDFMLPVVIGMIWLAVVFSAY